MPKLIPLITVLVTLLSLASNLHAKADFEVAELSATHLMVIPKTWALEEEKGTKVTIVSFRETFKEALLTLSTRYKIKSITPIEGLGAKQEFINLGGSLTVGLVLEVEKR
jgi:hypothetical protein